MPSLPFLPQRGPGRSPAEIKFNAFLPSKYTILREQIERFCGIWEHLKVENDISALFCDLGGYTIYFISEANLCVWGLSPSPPLYLSLIHI